MQEKAVLAKQRKGAGFYWLLTLLIGVVWLCCAAVFADLCLSFGGLSFGGGNNSGCVSHFNYPDLITGIAIAGVVLLIPVFGFVGLMALLVTFFRAN